MIMRDLILPQQHDIVVACRIQILQVQLADHRKVWQVNLEQNHHSTPQDS